MADDPLYVCSECGAITSGPQEGQHIPNWNKERGYSDDEPTPQGQTASYKGRPISHSICDDCTRKQIAEQRRGRDQGGAHWWFRKRGDGK